MHIRPCTHDDLYDFAHLSGLAMWDDEIMPYIAPKRKEYPDSYYRYVRYRVKRRWYRGELLMLCVSDADDADWTGKEDLLGYCSYSATVPGVPQQNRGGWLGNWFEQKALGLHGWYADLFRLDRSNDRNAERYFRSLLDSDALSGYFASLPQEHKNVYADQHWELEVLGTHPDHRRKGVGKLMLQEGMRRATESGVPLILYSSWIGEKLYLSQGFREVTRIGTSIYDPSLDSRVGDLDMGEGGGKGNGLTWAAMVWEPPNLKVDGSEDSKGLNGQ